MLRGQLRLAFIVLTCFLVISCSDKGNPQKSGSDTNKKAVTVEELEQKITSLQTDVTILQATVSILQNGPAIVSADSETYGTTTNQFGTFTVVCKQVTPYLDGYKVKLWIGNLTSASFNGIKLHVKYGENLYAPEKSKDFDLTDNLYPGHYTPVTIALTPATAKEIKTMQVSLELNVMRLYNP